MMQNWTAQNKVRPGTYVNVVSEAKPQGAISERGTVTMALSLSWGPSGEVMEIQAGENTLDKLGYDISEPQVLLVQEALKRAKTLLLYRLNTGAKAQATSDNLTVTALYGGIRGNDITVVVEQNIDDETTFVVKTLVAGSIVDNQLAKKIEDLKANKFVTFSGTGALVASAGIPLTGGTDGTETGVNHTAYREAIELHDFDAMAVPYDDPTIKSVYVAFAKRLANQQNRFIQIVVPNYAQADDPTVISVSNGVILSNSTVIDAVKATAWVAGATAGANANQSLTHTAYDDAVAVHGRLNDSQITKALLNGEFLFEQHNGKVVVEQDINTFTSFSPDKRKHFSKNRVVRTINGVVKDWKRAFDSDYLGKINNNDDGRNLYKKECIKIVEEYQAMGAIQNFDAQKDIIVSPGNDSDSLLTEGYIQPVDAMEKNYLKAVVR